MECMIQFQIFVSYCNKNKQVVHRVADELEKLKYKLWIDRNQYPGIHLYSEIDKGVHFNL